MKRIFEPVLHFGSCDPDRWRFSIHLTLQGVPAGGPSQIEVETPDNRSSISLPRKVAGLGSDTGVSIWGWDVEAERDAATPSGGRRPGRRSARSAIPRGERGVREYPALYRKRWGEGRWKDLKAWLRTHHGERNRLTLTLLRRRPRWMAEGEPVTRQVVVEP